MITIYKSFENFNKIQHMIYLEKSPSYLLLISSAEDSEAVSSNVEVEAVSTELLSLSEDAKLWSSDGCFKCQYIILAVSVRIIFWFT